MVWYCCVPACKMNSRNKGISFFTIPKNQSYEWLRIMKLNSIHDTTYLRVCSKHFQETDMYMAGQRRQLRKNVKPFIIEEPLENCQSSDENVHLCQNIPGVVEEPPMSYEELQAENDKLRNELALMKTRFETLQKEFTNYKALYETTVTENVTLKNEAKLEKEKNEELRIVFKRRAKVLTQPIMNIERFYGNDAKLLHYTGVQSFNIYYSIFRCVHQKDEEEHLRLYSDINDLRKHTLKISAENQMFLTLMRLRRCFPFETLGDLFGVSPSTAQKIFNAWINLLCLQLGSLDFWQHRDVIINNTPQDFKLKYPNVIGSIDCTEFYIEQPSSLITQSQCYSKYKSTTTMKSLIMSDPMGYILYISPLFNGSISDKQIIVDSGFLAVLKEKVESGDVNRGDIILADKGFNVMSLFNDIDVELNIPTYRLTGYQFSEEEIQHTRSTAHERVYVERAIGRLKSFNILKNKIHISALESAKQIYVVCCLLTNFREPLRKINK